MPAKKPLSLGLAIVIVTGCSGVSTPRTPGAGSGPGRVPKAVPAALTFDSGSHAATPAQTLTIEESGYAGGVTVSSSACLNAQIASVSPTTAMGPTTQFSVTPLLGGTCSLSFSDSYGQTVTVAVTVTDSQLSISRSKGK